MSTASDAETHKAAELAARAAYIKAGNDYTASGLSTMSAESALQTAKSAERSALSILNKARNAWNQATETLNAVEEEALITRSNKFRAVVCASGLITRAPSAGLSYKSGNSTEDESGDEDNDGNGSPAEYIPKSPDHTPGSSPRALSPLVSSSVIDSWQ